MSDTYLVPITSIKSLHPQWYWENKSKAEHKWTCVFSYTRLIFLLLWPWPSPNDLDTWPDLDIPKIYPHTHNEVSIGQDLQRQTDRQTDRRDRTHYNPAFVQAVIIESRSGRPGSSDTAGLLDEALDEAVVHARLIDWCATLISNQQCGVRRQHQLRTHRQHTDTHPAPALIGQQSPATGFPSLSYRHTSEPSQRDCVALRARFNPFSPLFFWLRQKWGHHQSVQRHTGLTHPFYFFDIRALWRSVLSARVPECQKIKKDGLDRYGLEHFQV